MESQSENIGKRYLPLSSLCKTLQTKQAAMNVCCSRTSMTYSTWKARCLLLALDKIPWDLKHVLMHYCAYCPTSHVEFLYFCCSI